MLCGYGSTSCAWAAPGSLRIREREGPRLPCQTDKRPSLTVSETERQCGYENPWDGEQSRRVPEQSSSDESTAGQHGSSECWPPYCHQQEDFDPTLVA